MFSCLELLFPSVHDVTAAGFHSSVMSSASFLLCMMSLPQGSIPLWCHEHLSFCAWCHHHRVPFLCDVMSIFPSAHDVTAAGFHSSVMSWASFLLCMMSLPQGSIPLWCHQHLSFCAWCHHHRVPFLCDVMSTFPSVHDVTATGFYSSVMSWASFLLRMMSPPQGSIPLWCHQHLSFCAWCHHHRVPFLCDVISIFPSVHDVTAAGFHSSVMSWAPFLLRMMSPPQGSIPLWCHQHLSFCAWCHCRRVPFLCDVMSIFPSAHDVTAAGFHSSVMSWTSFLLRMMSPPQGSIPLWCHQHLSFCAWCHCRRVPFLCDVMSIFPSAHDVTAAGFHSSVMSWAPFLLCMMSPPQGSIPLWCHEHTVTSPGEAAANPRTHACNPR